MAKPDTKLGKPVDIDRWLGKARNRIRLVGIELEGGWDKLPQPKAAIIRDGSVVFADRMVNYIGELPSPPMDVAKIPGWMTIFHPAHVNETCGMHVHMSLKNALSYDRLMDNRYPATIISYLTRWAQVEGLPKSHGIWERLAGENRFCQHVFHPDEQVKTVRKDHDQHRPGHRYTAIHYPYSRNGTVECRLLPMMKTPEQGTRAVLEVINITNAFLVATAKREKKIKISTVVESEILSEARNIMESGRLSEERSASVR